MENIESKINNLKERAAVLVFKDVMSTLFANELAGKEPKDILPVENQDFRAQLKTLEEPTCSTKVSRKSTEAGLAREGLFLLARNSNYIPIIEDAINPDNANAGNKQYDTLITGGLIVAATFLLSFDIEIEKKPGESVYWRIKKKPSSDTITGKLINHLLSLTQPE